MRLRITRLSATGSSRRIPASAPPPVNGVPTGALLWDGMAILWDGKYILLSQ